MAWDREQIVPLLERTGAMGLELRDSLEREYKADQSIVTQADRQIEDEITKELEDPENGVFIIGEETVDQKGEAYLERAQKEECFVIDPIDGTSPYAHGMPYWGVSIGHMIDGELVNGAVYLPCFAELVVSDGDQVLEGRLRDGEWSFRELTPPEGETHVSQIFGVTQRVAKYGRLDVPNPVNVLGAAVVPLVGLLQQRFAAYLGSVRLWDVAGALPLALKLGYSASVREGDEVRPVTARVEPATYHLEPGSPDRWKFRSELLVCREADQGWLREAFQETV
ncbi:MAG: inositol monophosphatase family protein [Planctomycetota bacterium]